MDSDGDSPMIVDLGVDDRDIETIEGPLSREGVLWHIDCIRVADMFWGGSGRQSVEDRCREALRAVPYEVLTYACDLCEGVFEGESLEVTPSTYEMIKAELHRRTGGATAGPSDRPGTRIDPEVDVVVGDCGLACRGKRDVYWRSFNFAGGADCATSSQEDMKWPEPDGLTGLAQLVRDHGDEGAMNPECEEGVEGLLVGWDWSRVQGGYEDDPDLEEEEEGDL